MEPIKSGLYKLGTHDLVKGVLTGVLAAVITVAYGVTSQVGFDVMSTDWGALLNDMINVSVTTTLAYLFKNFITDDNDHILGK